MTNYSGIKYTLDYSEMGIAVLCNKTAELDNMIDLYLNKSSTEYKELAQRQKGFQYVGNAARNIADVIERCVS